ncbi:TetR/AcrR family transcriptional regulator C-terminal domain-containing protein [Shimazuella sp. AN120528]|uniref:TetR/AcrR family transcriptional regulator C-terminal domain-containing protein n=1 Tax=Shimazuella soli TaxID=1892854 RepID=UPI001F0DC0D1|nr:TetR/AcrR family transcriptional regulator C-terminal domain-containing protein [Shimazuella soli]MCH5583689.1 TetR/AcrR family transcriptional regulator C-terminal domain-containing protein [Shimazuella soli]
MKRKGTRSLTRQKVLHTALELIDKEGLEGFSMRKLGTILGVEAMSIYNHIDNKDALFDGIIEHLMLEVPYPVKADMTPYDELWNFAHAYRDILRAHPRVLPLVATRPLRTLASLTILERLMAALHQAHVSGLQALYAINSMAGFIIGHELLTNESVPIASIPARPTDMSIWNQLLEEDYPFLHQTISDLKNWDADQEFDFGLQALLQNILKHDPKNS